MFSFRCTKVLTKKLGLPVTADPPPPTTLLGDWYGNVLNIGHQRFVMFISERSLLPLVMPLRERHMLLRSFKKRLAFLLVRLDIDAHFVSAELDRMDTFAIAPTANRSVLGSLNDFIYMAKNYIFYDGLDLTELALSLADTPCNPIDYQFPNELASALLAKTKE